jgi:hypothetical protein
MLPPLIGPGTLVVGYQNGVETVGTLTRAVGSEHTAGGVSYVSAVIAEPGVIRHTAMDHLIFGMPDGSVSPQLDALLEACRPAGFQATLSRDITVDIWTKFVRISVYSDMSAVTRGPIGVIVNDPELLEMLKAAARETLAVAHAKGVAVPATIDEDVAVAYKARRRKRRRRCWRISSAAGDRAAVAQRRGRPSRTRGGVATPIHGFISTVLRPQRTVGASVGGVSGLKPTYRALHPVSVVSACRPFFSAFRRTAALGARDDRSGRPGRQFVAVSRIAAGTLNLHGAAAAGPIGIRLKRTRAGRLELAARRLVGLQVRVVRKQREEQIAGVESDAAEHPLRRRAHRVECSSTNSTKLSVTGMDAGPKGPALQMSW